MVTVTLKQVETDIKSNKANKIFLCPKSLWWTHDENDLNNGKTPLGDKPIVNPNPEKFIKQTKSRPEWYGKHKMDAFMKAHHKNCEMKFYNKWSRYNDLIDNL